jgi:hypothetical protein
MLPKKCLSAKQTIFSFLCIFLLLLTLTQQSCKKFDTESVNIDKQNAVDKFLTVPAGTNPTVNRIINTIKQQENKFHFLDKIIEKEGFAMWKNARIMAPASSKKDIIEIATPGTSNPTTSTTPTNDTIVLIPLVLPNTSYVNSFISCNVNDTVGVRLYRGRDYSNHNFNKNIDSLNAHKIALTCMNLEYETFQHNTFNVKDKRLLNYRPDAKEPSKTTITIKPTTTTPTSWVTIFFYYDIEVNNENPNDVVCPVGQACQWTHTETIFDSYTTWIADFGNWDGASFPNDPWGGSGYDPCGGTCTPVLDGWQYEPPLTDVNGFYYSRITELNNILELNPFALNPCDSLNAINTYGVMFQQVALFSSPASVLLRIDSIRNAQGSWIVDNYNIQSLEDAYGPVVNCDFFPLKITQFPINPGTGNRMTAQEFLEYFRININQFITSPQTCNFSCTFGTTFNDCQRWNLPYENALGGLCNIYIPGNSGSVVLSDYSHYYSGYESHKFKFSTLENPFSNEHPVAGNREFGVYNSFTNPNEYTFYTMGVDRTWDLLTAVGNSALGGFDIADQLWFNIQQNLKNFVQNSGGSASLFNKPKYGARPKWNDVKDYLKKIITWEELKIKLGC